MSNAILSQPVRPTAQGLPAAQRVVAVALAIWFALVMFLGAGGMFVTPAGTPPLPILVGAVVPIVVFFAGILLSRLFKELVLGADLRFITAIQAWRFAGLGFLALYAHGVLPGMFAWPAGLGDLAIGASAPWLLVALIRRPGFASSRTFLAWNVLGVLDLVVAVGTGVLASGVAAGFVGEVTTGPMARLPLVLIPAYFVPIFIMLHSAALLQARRLESAMTA